MSSKSRKHSGKEAKAPVAARPPGATQSAPDSAGSGLDIPEKYLKKPPRKMSRLSYGFLVFFLIFALVAYVGGGLSEISGLIGSNDQEYLSWNRPGHGRTVVMASEFPRIHESFQKAFQIDPYLALFLGMNPERSLEAEDVARVIVLSQLAEDQSVVITDEDLGAHLSQALQFRGIPPQNYPLMVRSLGTTVEAVEDTLRKALSALRLTQLVAYAGATPTVEGIEALWNEQHEELAFDYVEAAAEDYAEQARAELPDDAALEAWLAGQPANQRSAFELPERRAFEMACYQDATATPAAGLLAAFPPKEGVDPEERANDYYGRVFAKRFRKAEPDLGPVTEQGDLPRYRPFEEVHDACLEEAPIHEALQAWLADLQARFSAGTAIDFAAEAAQHGLAFTSVPASTRAEIEGGAGLGGKPLADVAFFTPPQSFAYTVTVAEDRLAVVRVGERVEPTLPPFAEISERVAELWVEVRSAALAEEKLRALWTTFELLPAPEGAESATPCRKSAEQAFRTAVEAQGLAVAHRDWLDKGGNPGADPARDERAHQFLARTSEFLRLETDEVAEPRRSTDGRYVYLVRLAGKRPVPLDRMGPAQYAEIKSRARERTLGNVQSGLDFAFLERAYGLVLRPRETEASEGEGEGQPAASPPGS
jgi:hypothetical protein